VSRRVELGLAGGGVLLVTVDDSDVTALSAAYAGDGGFHQVTSEEGDNVVNLSKVTYLRVLPGEAKSRLGFGGGS
jgi:hypothetical protein